MELKGKIIAFLGDSITEGAGASSYDKVYHQLLKERCGLKEIYVDGIGGTRIARQQTPTTECPIFDKDFSLRVDSWDTNPDIIVVFGGTNDFGHGDAPFGCFGDTTKDTFYGACYELMEKLTSKYPSATVVFMTPLHRLNEELSFVKDVPKNIPLCDYVYAIKEVSEYFSIPVLDLFATAGMQSNIEAQNQMFFVDGLHPNDKGYARIADRLESFLKSL